MKDKNMLRKLGFNTYADKEVLSENIGQLIGGTPGALLLTEGNSAALDAIYNSRNPKLALPIVLSVLGGAALMGGAAIGGQIGSNRARGAAGLERLSAKDRFRRSYTTPIKEKMKNLFGR